MPTPENPIPTPVRDLAGVRRFLDHVNEAAQGL